MFYGIQNFRHFRETVSNPTNARYKIPKFQNITKLFYGIQKFRIFWGVPE